MNHVDKIKIVALCVAKALEKNGNNIRPINNRKTFRECLTEYKGRYLLWYEKELEPGIYTSCLIDSEELEL